MQCASMSWECAMIDFLCHCSQQNLWRERSTLQCWDCYKSIFHFFSPNHLSPSFAVCVSTRACDSNACQMAPIGPRKEAYTQVGAMGRFLAVAGPSTSFGGRGWQEWREEGEMLPQHCSASILRMDLLGLGLGRIRVARVTQFLLRYCICGCELKFCP